MKISLILLMFLSSSLSLANSSGLSTHERECLHSALYISMNNAKREVLDDFDKYRSDVMTSQKRLKNDSRTFDKDVYDNGNGQMSSSGDRKWKNLRYAIHDAVETVKGFFEIADMEKKELNRAFENHTKYRVFTLKCCPALPKLRSLLCDPTGLKLAYEYDKYDVCNKHFESVNCRL